MKKRLICDIHDDIIGLANDINRLDLPHGYKSEVRKLAKKIDKLARNAKIAGQSMEDRLNEYRAGIERLGFDRKK